MNFEKSFHASTRPHILMITNHGIHHWDIIPGLPDTGGQNVFVNQFSATLANMGFKITIINRGGYLHPVTGEKRKGVHYKDENQRILYLEDGLPQFVRKEDMNERLPFLAEALIKQVFAEESKFDLILSHYWDGAKLGILFNQKLPKTLKHIWVPHSLGAVKKRNIHPDQWEDLRINERIEIEKKILSSVDQVTATSAIIKQSLREDYQYKQTPLFLPPCIDTQRLHPHKISAEHPVWSFLGDHAGITPDDLRKRKIITEISRTDSTKRKDILIKAFAEINREIPDTFLAISIDPINKTLANELFDLIESLGIKENVAALGSVWDELPDIYAATDIYCTPSVMEGFGMTPQEAAATGVPVVASHLVPFATEYLLGGNPEEKHYGEEGKRLLIGEGAVVVPADDVTGFKEAILLLIEDPTLRKKMGENAYSITIPYFSWENTVEVFLKEAKISTANEKTGR